MCTGDTWVVSPVVITEPDFEKPKENPPRDDARKLILHLVVWIFWVVCVLLPGLS